MKGRIILGFFIALFGFFLLLIPLFDSGDGAFFSWVWGIPLLIFGIVLIFNESEDKIEQIKYKGGKK